MRTIKPWLQAYAGTWLALALLDALWLGLLARDFYQAEIGALMAEQVRVVPALLFYLGYPAALVALALAPRPAAIGAAALRGALVGLTAYATYDLTNLATLAGWSVALTLVDVAWGVLVSAAAAMAGWWAQGLLAQRGG